MWVVSKNESNCLLENKMVSTLIWRNVILLYVVKSNILWLTFKLSYHYRCNILCTVSFLLYIATKKLKQNHYCKQFYECSYHKKITLARFACLCLLTLDFLSPCKVTWYKSIVQDWSEQSAPRRQYIETRRWGMPQGIEKCIIPNISGVKLALKRFCLGF